MRKITISSLSIENFVALYMQVSFLAVDDLFPDWKIWNQFIDTTVSAFRLDGLTESHPIEVFILPCIFK
jgi:aminopeptidase N